MKIVGAILLFVGASTFAFAGVPAVPEISPASGAAAIALVSGAILVIRARRKR
jgi:hypothetical protein